MSEFLGALLGALVGALMVFVSELWKQVLDGKAAARLIYVESHQNARMCDWAAAGQFYRSLTDVAWQTHSVQVMPLLTAEASQIAITTYLGVPATQQTIDQLENDASNPGADGSASELELHSRDFQTVAYWMHVIENKTRFTLLFEVLKGRATLPTAEQVEQAIAVLGARNAG